MSIGGQSVAAKETFGVINPASGEVFAHARRTGPGDPTKVTAVKPC
jgi:hypothetical protein